VASLANRTIELPYEQAEQVIEDNVRAFENEKVYLVHRWKEMGAGLACSM